MSQFSDELGKNEALHGFQQKPSFFTPASKFFKAS